MKANPAFRTTKVAKAQFSSKNQQLDDLAKLLGLEGTAKVRAMIIKTMEYQHPFAEKYVMNQGLLVSNVLNFAQEAKLTKWEQFTPFLQNLRS